MPSPKQSSQRIRGKLPEKSMSFHGRGSAVAGGGTVQLRRPKTLPDLSSTTRIGGGAIAVSLPAASPTKPKLTKLLLNVTIQGSLGAVQVLMTPESTVRDLIASAVRQYVKECRRPVLPTSDPSGYDLHYSQFSLESLNRESKLAELGSRNFFLCKTKATATLVQIGGSGVPAKSGNATTTSSSSCSKEAENGRRSGLGLPWLKLMGFLQ